MTSSRNASEHDASASAGIPRWVKIFGIITAILAVLLVVMLLSGHGPGMHMKGSLRAPASTGRIL
jgi:hypothetical protein